MPPDNTMAVLVVVVIVVGHERRRHQSFAQATEELAANLDDTPEAKPTTLLLRCCGSGVLHRLLACFRFAVFETRRIAVVRVVMDVTRAGIEGKVACVSASISLVLLGGRHRTIGLPKSTDRAVGVQDIDVVEIDPARLTSIVVLWTSSL